MVRRRRLEMPTGADNGPWPVLADDGVRWSAAAYWSCSCGRPLTACGRSERRRWRRTGGSTRPSLEALQMPLECCLSGAVFAIRRLPMAYRVDASVCAAASGDVWLARVAVDFA